VKSSPFVALATFLALASAPSVHAQAAGRGGVIPGLTTAQIANVSSYLDQGVAGRLLTVNETRTVLTNLSFQLPSDPAAIAAKVSALAAAEAALAQARADAFARLQRSNDRIGPEQVTAVADRASRGVVGTMSNDTLRAAGKSQLIDYGPFLSATVLTRYPAGNATNKGIAIRVGANREGGMLFDTDLLRWSAGWTGGFLALTGVAFNGVHGANPGIDGQLGFVTSPVPGWTSGTGTPDFTDPRQRPMGPLAAATAKYRGLYVDGDRVVVSYALGDTDVLESPGLARLPDGTPVFTRALKISPSTVRRSLLVADIGPRTEPAAGPAASADGPVTGMVRIPAAPETATIGGLVGAPEGSAFEVQSGGRLVLRLPVLPDGAAFTLAVAELTPENAPAFQAWLKSAPPAPDLAASQKGGPARWKDRIVTQGVLNTSTTPDGAYTVDTITAPEDNPYNSWLRFGGFDFFADGHRAAITTWSGDVWLVTGIDDQLRAVTWKRFATGLHQPLGLRIVKDQIYVLGRDQITRLHDLNGDGEADFYENFNNDVIVTSSFHEFALDLQTDRAGNFYFAKGGAVSPGGRGWQVITPHTGTILRVAADGSKIDIFATGVRAPNGLGMGPNDELTVADNEGTWTPADRMSLVKQGDFLGVVDLSQKATPPDNYGNPIFWTPHGTIDNSGGGQAWIPNDQRWGPFGGGIVYTSYGKSTVFLVMREVSGGLNQGGVVRLPLSVDTGMMRARFNAVDGQLYLCGLKGWQTTAVRDGAFQRVRYTGKAPEMPAALHVRNDGLELTFSTPLKPESASDLQNYAIEQWNYRWTSNYGSAEYSVLDPEKQGHDPVTVKSVRLSADRRTVVLEIPGLKPVMQMKVKLHLESAAGKTLDTEIHNTIAHVPAAL
jgi:hypothetical protein